MMKNSYGFSILFGKAQNAANSLLAACYQGVIKPLSGCERLVSGGAKIPGVCGAQFGQDRQSSVNEGARRGGLPVAFGAGKKPMTPSLSIPCR